MVVHWSMMTTDLALVSSWNQHLGSRGSPFVSHPHHSQHHPWWRTWDWPSAPSTWPHPRRCPSCRCFLEVVPSKVRCSAWSPVEWNHRGRISPPVRTRPCPWVDHHLVQSTRSCRSSGCLRRWCHTHHLHELTTPRGCAALSYWLELTQKPSASRWRPPRKVGPTPRGGWMHVAWLQAAWESKVLQDSWLGQKRSTTWQTGYKQVITPNAVLSMSCKNTLPTSTHIPF